MIKIKLIKGDTVKIMAGKDAGQKGKIESIDHKSRLAVVTGKNLYKRHLKPRGEGKQNTGGITEIPRPMPISKLILVCPKCQKETRVGYRLAAGEKKRICRLCQAEI